MSDVSKYLQSIEDRIDACNTCEVLQAASDEIKEDLTNLMEKLNAQKAKLIAHSTPPVDLATTIAWITAQIDAVQTAITTSINEVTLITTKTSEILIKLENKITTLGCTFPPPSIP